MTGPRFVDAHAVRAAVTAGEAADAIVAALRAGLPGPADPPRSALRAAVGELLVMPSAATGIPAVKVLTIRDQGPGPRIQGVHLDFDPVTGAPRAVIDAAALTLVRTTAVSVAALRHIADPRAARIVVIGSGPQAAEHLDAIAAEWPIAEAAIVARSPGPARAIVDRLAPGHPGVAWRLLSRAEQPGDVRETLAAADIVVCATTAVEPVLEAAEIDGDVAVVAIGSHRPDGREVPGAVMGRAFVAVEDRATALREAGDVIMAIAEGHLDGTGIDADLVELVTGSVTAPTRGARVFKSVGMAWEDAVVGSCIAGD